MQHIRCGKMSEVNVVKCGLVYTPKSQEELDEFINRYNGSEKALVSLACLVYHNFIAHQLELAKGKIGEKK